MTKGSVCASARCTPPTWRGMAVSHARIHPSAWKGNSTNFRFTEFYEVRALDILGRSHGLRRWTTSFFWLYSHPLRNEEGEVLKARRPTLYLPALLGTLVAAVLMACAVVLSTVSEKAEATFPGKNGRIAYLGYDGNDYEIYTINSRGGAKRKVTNNNRDDYSPSYSPRAKRIAYVKFDGNDYEIYTIKVGGRTETKLTQNNADEAAPCYSPDGKKIAYMVYSNATGNTEIYTIYVGGGGKTKVTSGGQPSYSPDGKRIVYWDYHKTASNPHPDTEIYTINVTGEGKTQLTHNNNDEFTPDYSPDGRKVVFAGLAGLERNN